MPCSRSQASSPLLASRASSATALPASWSFDADTNGAVLVLRPSVPWPLRPAHGPRPRHRCRRLAVLPRVRALACVVPAVPQRVRRAARLAGHESALYAALRPSRRSPLSRHAQHSGRRDRASAPQHGEGPRQALHAAATGPRGHAGAEGDWRGRDRHWRASRAFIESPLAADLRRPAFRFERNFERGSPWISTRNQQRQRS